MLGIAGTSSINALCARYSRHRASWRAVLSRGGCGSKFGGAEDEQEEVRGKEGEKVNDELPAIVGYATTAVVQIGR